MERPEVSATREGETGQATHSVRRTARAKVNLYLHVLGKRPDGYHDLDSLVVFAELGDEIEVDPRSARNKAIFETMANYGFPAHNYDFDAARDAETVNVIFRRS